MSKPRNSSEVSNTGYIKGLIVGLMTLLATAVGSAEAKTTVNPESGFKRTSITKKSTKTEIDKILSEIAASGVDINSLSNISIMEALNQLGYEGKAWDQRGALYSFFGKKDAYKGTSSQNTFLVTALKTYLKDKVPTNSEEMVNQEITTGVQTKAATILTSSVITATEPKKENITPSIEPKIKETKQSVSDTLIGVTPSGKKYSELTADERLAEQQRLANEQIKAESGSPKATNELTSAIKLQTGSKTENDQKVDTLNGGEFEKSINEGRGLISLGVNFSSNQGALVNFMIGHMMGNNFASTVEVEVGAEEAIYLASLGYKINENNRVKITFEHFEQVLNFSFTSGSVKERMSQQSVGLAYEYRVPNEFIEFIQAKGYFTKAGSKDLSTVNLGTRDVVIDTVTLYELYRETRDEHRRLAGGTKVGGELSVGLVPWKDGKLKVATNFESIKYDTKYEGSKYDTARFGANLELSQKFLKDFEVKGSVGTSSSEELVYGAEINYQALDNLKIYFNGKQINRRAGIGGSDRQETRFGAGLTWVFGDKQALAQSAKSYNDAMKSRMDEISKNSKLSKSEVKQVAELLSWIAKDPVVRSNTVLVVADKKIETTSTRLIAIDKTLLPAGSDVDAATGNILQDIVPAIGFNNITFNGAPFTNNGEFSIDNLTNKLIINTGMLAIPAVGATNTYIITIDEVGGGQTIINLQTERGSVKIKSMTVTRVGIDINPPTIGAPTAVVSNNSANVTNNITDVDGIQNVVYYLYSDSAGTVEVTNNSTGIFSGLNASTDYWIKTTAQTKNNPANTRTTRTSSLVKITTLANDISTTLSAPTFGSKTDTSITISDSTINFTDADGIQNTEIQISTDPAFGTVSGTLPGLTGGTFSGLTASTTYYIRIVGEARNGTTSAWQSKVTPTLTVVTSSAEVVPVMGNVPDQTYTSGSAITNLNVSNYVTLTNGDTITTYTLTGTLPTGLSFNSTTGVLSGTPTQTGTFNMSVTATDNDGVSNSDSFTITVGVAPDSTPDQFTFVDQTGVALSTLIESAPIMVAGINTTSSISVTGGEYAISTDGSTYGAYTAVAGTVNNGNYVKVRQTSSASNSTKTDTTLTIGGVSDVFSLTTEAPAAVLPTSSFASASVTKLTTDGTFTNTFTTNSAGAVTYSSNNTAVATVNASTGLITIVGAGTATITANQAANGGYTADTDTFTLTVNAAEVAPVMGNVPDQTYTSGSVITNLNVSNYVSLTNGDAITAYTLTGTLPTGLSFNSATGVLSGTPTQTGTFNMSVTATDNDGVSNSDSFTITVNAAPDSTPDQFTFSDQTGVALSTLIESAPIIVAGINTASSISVAGGEYAISTDGGTTYSAYTAVAGTVNNGNYVKVRHTSSASNSTATNTTLVIGGTINDMFTSITVAANVAPTANNFIYDTNIGNAAKTFDWKVLSAAADANGDSLTASIKTPGTKGTSSISGNNLTYTPNAGQGGSDTIVVTISDGNGGSVDITITVNGIDTAAPGTPNISISSGATYTNSTANAITITESDNVGVTGWYVSESSSTPTLASSWSSTKPTTGTISSGDGTKTLYVWTKDAAGNISAAGSDTIVLDTVAPSSMSFSGTIPDTKNSAYTGLILALGEDLTGGSLTSLTSSTGGTISGTISGGNIVFDWTTPNAGGSQLRAIGTDRAGNAFDLLLSVSLPN